MTNEDTITTSAKLRKIRAALPPEAAAARVSLARIIIEVEVLEDVRIAMNRTLKKGCTKCALHQQTIPPAKVTKQLTLDL